MGRVVLVNDSKFEGVIIKDALSSMGYNVLIADEFSALEKILSFRPDYIIVNYIMKEIHGDQLIGIVKMQNPSIKCILSSSNPIEMNEFRFKRIDAVLQTPADKAKLENIFRKLDKNVNDNAGFKSYSNENIRVDAIDRNKIPDPKTIDPGVDTFSQATSINKGDVAVKFCPDCGKNLQNDSGRKYAFCPFCGYKL